MGKPDALLALGSKDVTEDLEANTTDPMKKRLVAIARVLLPPPPPPGIVGNEKGLKSRGTVDSGAGIVWLVDKMSDYKQEFSDGGYLLETWSFFNDNGAAQRDRVITPLIFQKKGDRYQLTGIGKTRTNAGTGLQTFPFEPVAGRANVGKGYFFGGHTGDTAGAQNAGVVEFDTDTADKMTILSAAGQPKIAVGKTCHEGPSYPRTYSIHAVSKKK